MLSQALESTHLRTRISDTRMPRAWHCAAENLEKYKVPTAELLPDYMRKAEAEQKLEAGQLPICKGPIQE